MPSNDSILFSLHDIEEYLRSRSGGGGELLVSPSLNRREKEILKRAGQDNIKIRHLDEGAFAKRASELLGSPLPKGLRHLMLAVSTQYLEKRRADSDLWSILEGSQRANPLVLILDGITDPHNLGAILRSANLFDVEALVLPKKRSAQVNDTVRKVSAGASHHTPVIYVPNLVRVIEQLKERDFWVYSADLNGSAPSQVRLSGKIALILGSEGRGPSREVSRHCDQTLTIPSGGQIDSFNVSVAAGILMYEIRRQAPV